MDGWILVLPLFFIYLHLFVPSSSHSSTADVSFSPTLNDLQINVPLIASLTYTADGPAFLTGCLPSYLEGACTYLCVFVGGKENLFQAFVCSIHFLACPLNKNCLKNQLISIQLLNMKGMGKTCVVYDTCFVLI